MQVDCTMGECVEVYRPSRLTDGRSLPAVEVDWQFMFTGRRGCLAVHVYRPSTIKFTGRPRLPAVEVVWQFKFTGHQSLYRPSTFTGRQSLPAVHVSHPTTLPRWSASPPHLGTQRISRAIKDLFCMLAL
jgi:hypothetical protein